MKPGVLIILDGFGIRKQKQGNAVRLAQTPFFDWLNQNCPESVLEASGNSVGLPGGFMGNSEVGHITLGSGRIVWESLEKINQSIRTKKFFQNPAFLKAAQNCRKHHSSLHLMGMVSDKGVHAHIQHLFALLEFCKKQKMRNVWIHFFADGRDTKPKEALKYLSALNRHIKKNKIGRIGTVMGRFFAMDRDKRWHRVHKAFDCLANARGLKAKNAKQAILEAYSRGESDEFITPTVLNGFQGIQENDSVVFFNYRLDRGRELTKAFTEKKFSFFKRKKLAVFFVAMCPYYSPVRAAVAFEETKVRNGVGETLSRHGLKQARIAETEKYAHATYFFNGQVEKPFAGEKRFLFHSPKVKSYDRTPQMRAVAITNQILKLLKKKQFDAIIANFANGDMVGHTGNLKAAVQAVQTLDASLTQIVPAVLRQNGFVLITADHGNCESMGTPQKPEKSHTTNPVPCWLACNLSFQLAKKGKLFQVAPTFLELLEIPKPKEMGKSLLEKN